MLRTEKIQAHLNVGEAVLITSDANRLYYTGFPSSAGCLVITKNTSQFLIDFRYFEKAREKAVGFSVILLERFYKQVSEILLNEHIKTVFLETASVSIDRLAALKKNMPDFHFSTDNKISELITKQRSIKSADEIAKIKEAQRLTDETFSYILGRIKPGITEKEIMLDMEFFMRKSGSCGVSFDFIVVSGKNSSLPHGVPTDKKIEKGDFITMDFGAVTEGYRSDMTRTVAVGSISEKQRFIYETVLKAQTAAIGFIKPGVRCCDVDLTARDVINSAGFKGCFGHGLGHSVGIEIHESPSCNTTDETIMQPGMIMTVEPGIYLANEFGVRIEDMVIVTENGCNDITNSKKNLIVL